VSRSQGRNLLVSSDVYRWVQFHGTESEGDYMARDTGSGRMFGRIDPFCWFAVGPIVLVAAGIGILGGVLPAILLVCFAVLLVLFDSWVNRNAPPKGARRDAGRYPDSRPSRPEPSPPRPPSRRSPPPRRRAPR
jgi:hypothetical protein